MFSAGQSLVLSVMVIVSAGLLLALSWYFYRRIETYDDYNVAGRRTSLFPLICTLVGTAIGGSTLLGFMSAGFASGVGQIWLPGAITVTGVILLFFFVSRIRAWGERHNMVTLADFMVRRYGTAARLPTVLSMISAYAAITGMQFVGHRQLATERLKGGLCVGALSDDDPCDFRPNPMSLSSCLAAVIGAGGGGCPEEIGDLVVRGEIALRLPGRLEAFHDPLAPSGRLMAVLGAVVEASVLAMLDTRHDDPRRCAVAAQLVGDHHTRNPPLPLHQLAQQALRGLRVPPALDEDVQHHAMLIDRPPEPVCLAADRDHHLVEVPLVAGCGLTPADLGGIRAAEFPTPSPDRLMADHDAALSQHLLDHPQAQREAEVQPYGLGNDRRGIAMAGIEGSALGRHQRRLPGDYESYQTAKLTVPLKQLETDT